MTTWYRVEDRETGEAQHVTADSGADLGRQYPAKRFRRRKLDREPGEFDDVVGGKVERNGERAAAAVDSIHAVEHGHAAIAQARALKAVDAAFIIAGLPPLGLVEDEAKALGVDPADLARDIVAKARDGHTVEVARIIAKRDARRA